ncbi:Hypothetical predicted protein [Octopus vulgaris]|uniref:Uncharacterized protein n=1 Tax=Octopus vulgaris TaxID=6645 RepID=A0AA36B3K3_OCTVU|nr:Hypothetical predicted protein [Octopus vulgaris]
MINSNDNSAYIQLSFHWDRFSWMKIDFQTCELFWITVTFILPCNLKCTVGGDADVGDEYCGHDCTFCDVLSMLTCEVFARSSGGGGGDHICADVADVANGDNISDTYCSIRVK